MGIARTRSGAPMKRWLLATLLVAMVGSGIALAPVDAQDTPTAGPLRQFDVEGGHFVGLSPDGTMYAAAILRSALCVYSAETLEEISCASLEPVDAGIRYEDVVWSPDSTRLAFAEQAFVLGVDGDLWVMDAKTGELTNVTDDGYAGSFFSTSGSNDDAAFFIDVTPAWTPDGQFLTFSRSGFVDGERTGNVLAQVAATGGEVETLATVSSTEPGIVYFGTGWAPDGQTFYYSLTHLDQRDPANGIWAYDASTGETAQLATAGDPDLGPLTLLQISPGGDQLLAWYPQAFGQLDVSEPLLRLVDTSTGTLSIPDSPTDVPDNLRGFVWATFSPDGTALLMLVSVGSRQNELWVTDLATGTQTKVLDGFDSATLDLGLTPGWGANGNVAFGHGIGTGYLTSIAGIGTSAIETVSTEAGTPAAVSTGTPVGGEVRNVDLPDGRAVSLSPDGRLLAVVVLPSTSLCIYDVETMAELSCADLTVLAAGIRVEDIVWSPDSTRLAFGERSFLILRDGDLWVMDAQTGALENLTDDNYDGRFFSPSDQPDVRFSVDVSPAWTPDSQFITFSRTNFVGKESQGNVVAQIPSTGGEVETLATVSTSEIGVYYYRAAWSPDGDRFYYTVSYLDHDNPDNGIWVYAKATGETRLLAKSDDPELGQLALKEVSPAADRLLAYYPAASGQFAYVNRSVLRFVDPTTGALSAVPDPAPESEIFGGGWIATFSPDGQYFLQAVGINASSRDFWTTNLATGEATIVATGLQDAIPIDYSLGPVWASNGLVFVSRGVTGAYFFPIVGAGLEGTAPASPVAASPVAGAPEFAPGDELRTTGIAPMFSGPNADASIVAFLPPDRVVQVLAAPVHNDQGDWYPVLDPESHVIGYVQGNRLAITE